jgi:hypothetical protein
MKFALALVTASLALTALSGTTATAAVAKAPEPVGGLEPDSFYMGAWREIARVPTKETLGCVGGEMLFGRTETGGIITRETCRLQDPVAGQRRVASGTVKILNPGTNTKYRSPTTPRGRSSPRPSCGSSTAGATGSSSPTRPSPRRASTAAPASPIRRPRTCCPIG